MVKIEGKGKFYCKQEKHVICENKTKTSLCRIKDKSCIFIDYQLILKVV